MKSDYLKNKRILIVDDEKELVQLITTLLENEGYHEIMSAGNVEDALSIFQKQEPDIIILDIMLPDGDGYNVLKQIRKNSFVPVLFLSAKDGMEDQYHGFHLGADDYLTKPFLPKELLLRIQALLRRAYPEKPKEVRLKSCTINFETAIVQKNGANIPLTAKEYAILIKLYKNANKIVTIDAICQATWGDAYFGYENSLMAHIRRIREKIEKNPSSPESLITLKGLGYKLITERE